MKKYEEMEHITEVKGSRPFFPADACCQILFDICNLAEKLVNLVKPYSVGVTIKLLRQSLNIVTIFLMKML